MGGICFVCLQVGFTEANAVKSVTDQLSEALSLQKQGRVSVAEHIYRSVLQSAPGHLSLIHI